MNIFKIYIFLSYDLTILLKAFILSMFSYLISHSLGYPTHAFQNIFITFQVEIVEPIPGSICRSASGIVLSFLHVFVVLN